jgi:hypothetical protein
MGVEVVNGCIQMAEAVRKKKSANKSPIEARE